MARRGRGRGRQPGRGTSGSEQDGAASGSRFPRLPAEPLSTLRPERGKAVRGRQKRRLTESPLALFLLLRFFQGGLFKKQPPGEWLEDGTESRQQAWNSSDALPWGGLPPLCRDPLFLYITSFWPKDPPQISQWPSGFWAL